jgi:hypothetical protein
VPTTEDAAKDGLATRHKVLKALPKAALRMQLFSEHLMAQTGSNSPSTCLTCGYKNIFQWNYQAVIAEKRECSNAFSGGMESPEI